MVDPGLSVFISVKHNSGESGLVSIDLIDHKNG
jgi:hypothetical protein